LKKQESKQDFEQLFQQANTPIYNVNQILNAKNDRYLKASAKKPKESKLAESPDDGKVQH
jgi:hypothetical protein